MRARWVGISLMVIAAVAIVIFKDHRRRAAISSARPLRLLRFQPVTPSSTSTRPEMLLVVDLREADEPGDNCAEIIRLVREASSRGVKVQVLSPHSDSPLLQEYHVLTNPTVLILDREGKVVSRYEGESGSTVKEIRERLASLGKEQR